MCCLSVLLHLKHYHSNVISYSHNIINEPFVPSNKSLYIYVIYTSNSWILIFINTMYSFLLYIWHSKIIRANSYTLSPVHYLIRRKYQLRFVTQHISNKLFVISNLINCQLINHGIILIVLLYVKLKWTIKIKKNNTSTCSNLWKNWKYK